MGKDLIINNFENEYVKIHLYNANDNFIAEIDNNQFLDVRIQAYLNKIEGLYVIYPNKEKGFINHETGGVSYFPENLWRTTIDLSRNLMYLQQNDVKIFNSTNIVE
jgi:hypothetical protein